MPFDLKNAPAELCRKMHQFLGNLKFTSLLYLDDITVYGKNFEQIVER